MMMHEYMYYARRRHAYADKGASLITAHSYNYAVGLIYRCFSESMNSLTDSKKPWVTKLSSAGLVYLHFGRRVIQAIAGTDGTAIIIIFNPNDSNRHYNKNIYRHYLAFLNFQKHLEIVQMIQGTPIKSGYLTVHGSPQNCGPHTFFH